MRKIFTALLIVGLGLILVGVVQTRATQTWICWHHESQGHGQNDSSWTQWMPDDSVHGHAGHIGDYEADSAECGELPPPTPTETQPVPPTPTETQPVPPTPTGTIVVSPTPTGTIVVMSTPTGTIVVSPTPTGTIVVMSTPTGTISPPTPTTETSTPTGTISPPTLTEVPVVVALTEPPVLSTEFNTAGPTSGFPFFLFGIPAMLIGGFGLIITKRR